MSGGRSSKLGNWYEQDWVHLELLRVLNGEYEELVWEPGGTDGEGIDYIITTSDAGGKSRRIAVQAKKCDVEDGWTPSRLKGILADAGRRLASEGPASQFWFVTSARAIQLERLVEAATSAESAARWSEGLDTELGNKIQTLGFRTGTVSDWEAAWSTLSRVRVKVESANSLREGIVSLAKALGNVELERTVEILRASSVQDLFGRPWTAPRIRTALAHAGVNVPAVESANTQLADSRSEFFKRVAMARHAHEAYARPEADKLHHEVDRRVRDDDPAVVLLHGPAGCGKSEVLAQAIRKMEPSLHRLAVVHPTGHPEFDPIQALRRSGPSSPAILVIDQFDEMLLSGQPDDGAWKISTRWLREALDARYTIVLGCRTVDAENEGTLRALLDARGVATPTTASAGASPIPLVRIAVGDLTEAQASGLAKAKGLSWEALSERAPGEPNGPWGNGRQRGWSMPRRDAHDHRRKMTDWGGPSAAVREPRGSWPRPRRGEPRLEDWGAVRRMTS